MGIINQEKTQVNYRIEVVIDGAKNSEIGPISLKYKEKWDHQVSFTPTKVGDHQKVEFLLDKDGGVDPYLSLNLWIDVK